MDMSPMSSLMRTVSFDLVVIVYPPTILQAAQRLFGSGVGCTYPAAPPILSALLATTER
uniref:Uncharacterized protein n=1 Tax=Oryza sativa subsp. japonica TaxID=39947 RepID=Q658G4_ORYSJ|nr:hypothetical protein [Oryza sativa Japonica Group]BAD67666.1 hypothetical protein [Oryza sativa Japonica Group]